MDLWGNYVVTRAQALVSPGVATPLPLTREDIPILVQQVLQALPGPSTSASGHFSIVDDPPPPQQSQDPTQCPSEL